MTTLLPVSFIILIALATLSLAVTITVGALALVRWLRGRAIERRVWREQRRRRERLGLVVERRAGRRAW
jgi:Flp pilus assembly protein TadB